MATYLHPERSRSVGVDQRQEGGGEKDRKSGSNAVPNWVDGGGQQRGGERYTDHRTKLIIKAVFGEYCPACQKYLKDVEKEVTRLKHSNPKDAEFVRRVAQQIVEFLTLTDQLDVNMESFTKEKWNLHAGNMHSEFYKVFHETFRTDINWGRILMFVGFAVSFSVHLEEGTVPGAADSVLEWSCQIVEEDLGAFFVANKGWVSSNVACLPCLISKHWQEC